MFAGRLFCCLLLSSGIAFAQNAAPSTAQPPNVANFSVMLVNPVAGGGAVVLMHNPKNELELVDVAKIKDAVAAGYVPVRAVEIGELIASLKGEVARLTAENQRLQPSQPMQASTPAPTSSTGPSQAEIEAQRQAQAEAEKTALRQQMILQLMRSMATPQPQTQNLNVNVRDCTRFPALCAGR